MNSIRVQVHLKCMLEESSSSKLHHFWYAFHPSNVSTIKDLLEDIRVNYLSAQLAALGHQVDDNDERTFIVHLDDCQLLPFTSSQILRDNDRLTLMPLTQYKLHRKALEDTIQLNAASAVPQEPQPTSAPVSVPETNPKRQRVEETIPTQSSISIVSQSKPDEEQTRQKKPKVKPVEAPPPPVSKQPESEPPVSLPSTNGRLRELKSKTPAWKAEKPQHRGNAQDRGHVRFDSNSDEDNATSTPVTNGTHSSISIERPASLEQDDPAEKPVEIKAKPKKTIDLLFEMKQCKEPDEKQGKKIQQQFGRKRAQHRKRAMGFNALATFVDQAFGLDRAELEKQVSSNDCQSSSSSTPQALPSSFSKLARLPLVAEVIETNDKIYDLYPPVPQCPSIDTRIAFKLLELSEDFCPKLSEFREATVIQVDQSTGEVTLQLDKPLQTVFHQPSKFYAPNEDEQEDYLTTMVLPFSDLHSVRLVSESNGHGQA